MLLGSPRDEAGNLIILGTGQQHWSTVHVVDLADFFRRALEDSARGYYVIGDGQKPTVAELTEAAAVARGRRGGGARSGPGGSGAAGRLFRRSPLARPGDGRPRPEPTSVGGRPIRHS